MRTVSSAMWAMVCSATLSFGCNQSPATSPATEKQATAPAQSAQPTQAAALRLGAPIESAQNVTLADVAKDPKKFQNTTFVTTGTVSAVCQHMGCWMELKDASGEAHIKMAGHKFFVPKTASGKKARVMAKLVTSDEANGGKSMCAEEGHAKGKEPGKGCKEEAEQQLGRPLAKLELEALGVELVD